MSTVHSIPAAQTALDASSDQSLRVPCYCEENVWRLAYRKTVTDVDNAHEYYVAFVSNPNQCVPMFHQIAASKRGAACYWDYHVILLRQSAKDRTVQVLDMDSHLAYPSELDDYINQAFSDESDYPENYRAHFRLIQAKVFLETFGSDRMHMFKKETNEWSAPPPRYPCIKTSSSFNLEQLRFISGADVRNRASADYESDPLGAVYSIQTLRERFQN